MHAQPDRRIAENVERFHRRLVFQERLIVNAAVEFHEVAEVGGNQWPAACLELLHEVIAALEPAELRRGATAKLQIAVLLSRKDERDIGNLASRPTGE